MPLFSYRAIDEDGKQVQGTLEAPTLEAAKVALGDMHLDSIDVSESMRLRASTKPAAATTEQPLLKTAYAFEGRDTQGTVRRGTIQAATKRQAFDRLFHDQKLSLTSLTPLGLPPSSGVDADLVRWQTTQPPLVTSQPIPATAFQPSSILTSHTEKTQQQEVSAEEPSTRTYHSLLSTLRLYAGWLMAWYALFLALGYYYSVRSIAIDIPMVQGFSSSPLVMSFVLAMFLFLLFTSLHRALNGGKVIGMLLTLLGVGGFVGSRMLLIR